MPDNTPMTTFVKQCGSNSSSNNNNNNNSSSGQEHPEEETRIEVQRDDIDGERMISTDAFANETVVGHPLEYPQQEAPTRRSSGSDSLIVTASRLRIPDVGALRRGRGPQQHSLGVYAPSSMQGRCVSEIVPPCSSCFPLRPTKRARYDHIVAVLDKVLDLVLADGNETRSLENTIKN